MRGGRKRVELIPFTIFWIVLKEKNKMALDGVDNADGF